MGDSSTLAVGNGRNCRLVQFHFRHPSEHTINGASFPMEVHFVHANTAGNLAVIGVLMTTGKVNKVFNTIVLTMPNLEGPAIKADSRIDPNAFLPSKRSYYRYEGSLTTPPCAETVNWFVLTESIQVAEVDINSFTQNVPHECASGAEGQPAFRAALVVTWVYQSANDCFWHECEVQQCPRNDRFGKDGLDILTFRV